MNNLKVYTLTYKVEYIGSDSLPEYTISYNTISFAAAVEQFRKDQQYITAKYIKDQQLLESSGQWSAEEIGEGDMSDEDVVRNFNQLIEDGVVTDFNILLLI